MRYRIAQPGDFENCAKCVASTGYYSEVDFLKIGGIILLAENDEGIQGVVWATRSGEIAFADYLSVAPKYQGTGLGIKLMAKGYLILKQLGVKRCHSLIHQENKEALKIAKKVGSTLDGPYTLNIAKL